MGLFVQMICISIYIWTMKCCRFCRKGVLRHPDFYQQINVLCEDVQEPTLLGIFCLAYSKKRFEQLTVIIT